MSNDSFPGEDAEVKTQPAVIAMTTAEALGLDLSEALDDPTLAPSTDTPVTLSVQATEVQHPAYQSTPEETEILELQMPMCLAEPTAEDSRFTFQLYSGDCLDCDELVENGEVAGRNLRCHVSKGNVTCPAGEIKMIFVGPRNFWLQKCLKAKESGDSNRYLDTIQELRQKDAPLRDWVMSQLGLL